MQDHIPAQAALEQELLTTSKSIAKKLEDLLAVKGVTTVDSSPGTGVVERRPDHWERVRAAQYLTNDLVDLARSSGPRLCGVLRLNGLKKIRLSLREYLFMLALVYAQRRSNQRRGFTPAQRLITIAEGLGNELLGEKATERIWKDAVYDAVPRLVQQIRRKVIKQGGLAVVIESSDGSGYRLSTAPWNVRVHEKSKLLAGEDEIPDPPVGNNLLLALHNGGIE